MNIKQTILTSLLILLSFFLGSATAFSDEATYQPSNFQSHPALFEVTTDILNSEVEPFSVTVTSFGNNLNRKAAAGFEPVQFRTKMVPGETSPNRIIPKDINDISSFNSWSSGYLDDATAYVYRITNGKLNLIRTDRVVDTAVAGWVYSTSRMVKPDQTEAYWTSDDWSRPNSTTWITIMSVDTSGNITAGEAVSVIRDDGVHKAKVRSLNKTKPFRKQRNASDTNPPPAPQHITATAQPDHSVKITWDAVNTPDLAGYFIATSDVPPKDHKGYYLELEQSPKDPDQHIHANDLVILHHEYRTFDRNYRSHRVANLWKSLREFYPDNVPNDFYPNEVPGKTWTLVDHTPDTPVTEPGRTYLEMTLRAGDIEKVGKNGIGDIWSTQHEYYPVAQAVEYKMEVWMKADRADAPPVTFEYDGSEEVGGFLKPVTFQPTTEWQKFETTFVGRPSDTGSKPVFFVLTCKGPATYSFDNYRLYRTDTPYLGFTDRQVNDFKDSGMATLRTHGTIKTEETTYSMDSFTNPGGVIEGIPKGNTLPQQLAGIVQMDAHPWLQIEFHMSPDEWLGFIEFMAAPYDPAVDSPATKPWAAKRYAQGRHAPWTDQFERIYFELSNETWNRTFRPWVFPDLADSATGRKVKRGEVYAMMHDSVVEIFQSSPYWSDELDEKFIHVLGGWINGSYNQELITTSQHGDFITLAAYNGGWDEGEGPPQKTPYSYFTILSHPNVNSVHRGRQNLELKQRAAEMGKTFSLGTYEAGPGYAMTGLNNARVSDEQEMQQEEVMKSKAAGVATLDSFLTLASYDFDLQNFFTFENGDYWKSHARWYRGGQAYPSFLALTLFNQLGTGDLLKVDTKSVSTADYPKAKKRAELNGGPLAAVYASRKDDRVTIFCINRQFAGVPDARSTGFTPFGITLPFTQAKSITLYRMTGAPTDHNIDAERVKVEKLDLAPSTLNGKGQFSIGTKTGGTEFGMPPAELFIYVFDGTNIGSDGVLLTPQQVLQQPMSF